MQKILDKYTDELTSFSQAKNEPDWFKKFRFDNLTNADNLDLPRYEKINYRSWRLDRLDFVSGLSSESYEGQKPQSDNYIYQIGERTISSNLQKELADKGVILTDIFTAVKEYPELIKKYFMTTATKPDENRLMALHAAFVNSGIFLYVPKNVHLTKSIQALFVQDNSVKHDFVHHVLVVAEDNSELDYLESYVTKGDEEENKANIVVEVVTGDNAKVHFSALDQLSNTTTTYLSRRGTTGRDSEIDWAVGFMNDGNVIGDFGTDLIGDGSHSETKVVAITTGKQTQGIDTKVTNYGKHTIGHILQHGVILESSTLTFNGVGHIVKGARR